MKRLALRQFPGGDVAVWEPPVESGQYIVSCDPSLGRAHTQKGDTSAVGVWRRHQGRRLEQVAEWVSKWPVGRVGEGIAALARAYGGRIGTDGKEHGNAIVNIERNLMDAAKWAMTENMEFPEEFLFVPRSERNVKGSGEAKVFFTIKDDRSEHYLLSTLEGYLDRKAILIRSQRTVEELRSLEKGENGRTDTHGKDRAIMTIMAAVADQELPPVEEAGVESKRIVEPYVQGRDRELWKKRNEPPKSRMPRRLEWGNGGKSIF